MSVKTSLVNIAKKLPGGLSLMCALNAKKVQGRYASLPVENNKIIFTNYMGKGFGCNPRRIAEELIKRGDKYDYVWAVSDPEAQKNAFPPGIRLVKYGSDEMMREYETARFWVCNYHLVDLFGHGLRKKDGQVYIQTWHGSFGIKTNERDVDKLTRDKVWLKFSKLNSACTDYWISNSAFETDVYKRGFWDVKNIKLFGHPRNDIFFYPESEKQKIIKSVRTSLGVEDGKKLLLYLPTYRDDFGKDQYSLNFNAVISALNEKTGEDWQGAVRLHPKLKERGESFTQGGVLDATFYEDVQELLLAADAVITDYSSAVFDFMLSYKPAFIYATDIQKYEKERGFYYDIHSVPFPVAESNEELVSAIQAFDAEKYKEDVKAFLEEKGSAEDGNASERVANLIESL